MKKIIVVFLFLLLTACTNGNSALNKLKEDYPTVKKEVEKLPKDIQNELVVPGKLPIKVKHVSMDVQKNTGNDTIIQTSFKYSDGKSVILYVETYHNKDTEFSGDDLQVKTTKLKDGTKAIIDADSESTKTIRWKKDGLYRSISLIKSPEVNKKYTLKDLVKTADSMNK